MREVNNRNNLCADCLEIMGALTSWSPEGPVQVCNWKVRNYRKLKEEAVDLAVLRTRVGRGYGRVARRTAK